MRARLAAAAAAAAAAVARAAQSIAADDATFVAWDGRAYPAGGAGGVGFQWLATGARVAHNGSVLRAQVLPTSHAYKLSFAQAVEGYLPQQGVSWVAPSDAGGPGLVVAVGPGRAVVALNTPPQYYAQQGGTSGIATFTTDGAFLPAVRSSRVLHFIGDSITAATNVVGGISPGGCADEGYQANWAASWSGILCNYFDADCTTVAMGGKGLVRNCCDAGLRMPDYYVRTRATDAEPTMDFAADRVPAGVVIYLCVRRGRRPPSVACPPARARARASPRGAVERVAVTGPPPPTHTHTSPSLWPVCSGTNDYSAGGNPALDASFTAAYLQFMHNITRVW